MSGFKGAIVGFGEAAQHGHWPAYAGSSQFQIVAVVERSAIRRELAAALPSKPSGPRVYETLAQLAEHERLDFIDICTPPALHGEPMLFALERGWHVVCEKPFLLDAGVLDRARALSRERGLAAVPVHNWKYAPIVLDAAARLRRSEIGGIRRVEIEVERLEDFKGADPDRPNWRRDPNIAGGGILLDHGWHALYLVLDWLDHQEPCTVAAQLHFPEDGRVEDAARVVLEFPRGEASISLTWLGQARRNTIRVVGQRGTIDLSDDRLLVNGREVARYPALSAGSHHADWFAAFVPQVAKYFTDPESSRAAFDEAAACYRIVRRAYDGTRRAQRP
jgi:predicted dehydrogenase